MVLIDNNNKINIHAYNETIFISSCVNGHLEVAKWLWNLDNKIERKWDLCILHSIFMYSKDPYLWFSNIYIFWLLYNRTINPPKYFYWIIQYILFLYFSKINN